MLEEILDRGNGGGSGRQRRQRQQLACRLGDPGEEMIEVLHDFGQRKVVGW
jgi:hypothetical protein